MTNFFNFNYTFPTGMNNWFMPDYSFTDYFGMFQFPSFNIFDSWSNQFNYSYNPFIADMSSSYPMNYNYLFNIPFYESKKTDSDVVAKNDNYVDTFTKKSDNKTKLDGYNPFKGERLANIALNSSVGWTGYCAAFVKRAIQYANLGSYKYGHAYQMSDILKNNGNFKEISPEKVDVSKLPAGCVLVYDKGTEGYSKKYGHTEITTGDGRAVSDGITRNLHKKPSSIFIPV